jgi:carbon-monoxide dehydrogenase small subunit
MKQLEINVNGRARKTAVQARTTLADFLREQCTLTGTNLGCEQGVCGACTLMVDGMPMRSCIIPAISCAGAAVRTIEDFDHDPLMAELRAAFTAEHALQCGYCTPGFLLNAVALANHGVVLEGSALREELAGNLCRCTGYQNIVEAVERYLRQAAGGRRDG